MVNIEKKILTERVQVPVDSGRTYFLIRFKKGYKYFVLESHVQISWLYEKRLLHFGNQPHGSYFEAASSQRATESKTCGRNQAVRLGGREANPSS